MSSLRFMLAMMSAILRQLLQHSLSSVCEPDSLLLFRRVSSLVFFFPFCSSMVLWRLEAFYKNIFGGKVSDIKRHVRSLQRPVPVHCKLTNSLHGRLCVGQMNKKVACLTSKSTMDYTMGLSQSLDSQRAFPFLNISCLLFLLVFLQV